MTFMQTMEPDWTIGLSMLTGLAGALLLLGSMTTGRRMASRGRGASTPNPGLFLGIANGSAMLGVMLYLAALRFVGLEYNLVHLFVVVGLFFGSILIDFLVVARLGRFPR